MKWYGGVPIITEVQEPVESSVVPRSSAKDCFKFICDDLERAETLLAPFTGAGQWMSGDNYGRVTSGTALALKGRTLLLYMPVRYLIAPMICLVGHRLTMI